MISVFNIKEGLVIGLLQLNKFAEVNNLNQKREIETKGKQYLINHLLNKEIEIQYDENGKPYLLNEYKHISITHSHDKIAIIINDFEKTGIDIELIRDKILKIKHKFLAESELINAENDPEKLLIYWGAKESLYKIYGLKEVDFIKNLYINAFIKNHSGTIVGNINMTNFNKSYELAYLKIEEYMLVYSLKEISAC